MAPHILSNISPALIFASQTPSMDDLESKENTVGDSQNSKKSEDHIKDSTKNASSNEKPYKIELVWRNVIIFIILHSIFLYTFYLIFTFRMKGKTLIFGYLYAMFAGFGITAGAHRLWAHRSYTAKLPLRIFLMFAQSAALQNDIHEWSRDHRVHHKFTDTDADPHNSSRGFFFSHIGWLMCKKHKDVFVKGKTVDMSDVLRDPVVRFQMRHYVPLVIMFTFLIPSLIPWYFWGEDGWISFIFCLGRYVLSLNGTWLVNSAAHIWGMKPYDKNMNPTENKFVAVVAFGEGWHNYHHVFPWDYKAAELGNYNWNFTTCFLDIMARIGMATDLKTASEEIIKMRVLRTGDGSWPNSNKYKPQKLESKTDYHHHHHHDSEPIWGWGDKDMKQEEINAITRMNRQKA